MQRRHFSAAIGASIFAPGLRAAEQGVSGGLLRISVGLEDATDLLADVLRALSPAD